MRSSDALNGTAAGNTAANPKRMLRALVWLLLIMLVVRYAFAWANEFGGASLPVLGRTGVVTVFAAFSLLHAATVLGWRRALLFLFACAAISWSFEAVGVATGAVYGAYRYGDALGLKLGAVPVIIPFAWFMMIYASWIMAHVLLEGASDPSSAAGVLARAVIAAACMTAWDAVMDPGMTRDGVWVWATAGPYFGVPFQNFVGWMMTALAVYVVAALLFRRVPRSAPDGTTRLYAGIPVVAYALIAFDKLLIATHPELHVVAAFSMCLVAALAILRLVLVKQPLSLPS